MTTDPVEREEVLTVVREQQMPSVSVVDRIAVKRSICDAIRALPPIESESEVERLRAAARESAETFRMYEKIHMEKGSIAGDVKARANAKMAELCEAALTTRRTREGE